MRTTKKKILISTIQNHFEKNGEENSENFIKKYNPLISTISIKDYGLSVYTQGQKELLKDIIKVIKEFKK